jgi:hypothetical protein
MCVVCFALCVPRSACVRFSTDGNGWWGDEYFNVTLWLESLHFIASHYGNTSLNISNAVAFSLRNELRNDVKNRSAQVSDWYTFVPQGVEVIHRANPTGLIFVSGINYDCDFGFLNEAHPHNRWDEVVSNLTSTLVFEAHIYEWSGYGNFTPTCEGAWKGFEGAIGWAYQHQRPLVLSEMGLVTSSYPNNAGEAAYWGCVTGFIQQHQLGFGVWVLGGSYIYHNGINTRDPFGNLDVTFQRYQSTPAFLAALGKMIVNFTADSVEQKKEDEEFVASTNFPMTVVPLSPPPSYADVRGRPYKVDYDYRSLRINGERVLLQSAGIHYPRSSPSMWPQLMQAAAAAGLNTVQTYVFHNYHESVRGTWDWSTEHRNLSQFLQAAADAGLFVNLRIGPYICGEWFYGGQPLWLHDAGFPFRQYNPGWTKYMQDMMTAVVLYVEPYLARNGGSVQLVTSSLR